MCSKCQRFGHVTSKFKHNEVYARFSAAGHKDATCTMAFKCVNCGENHASYKREYVIRKQRPSASVTSRPVLSVSRSVGTTTRVADVQKTVAHAKSSPPKKGEKYNKPSSPKQLVIYLFMSLMHILLLNTQREK